MMMLSRSNVAKFRQQVTALVGDPDTAVSLLALSWQRLLNDKTAGIQEANTHLKTEATERAFMWSLTKLWVLRASTHEEVVLLVRRILSRYTKCKSAKVQWHLRELNRRTNWVLKTHSVDERSGLGFLNG
jgi:uncharacterized protein (UPF0548 family)